MGTFTRMRREMPPGGQLSQAFRTRGCLPAPARERPVGVCGDGLRPKFAGISVEFSTLFLHETTRKGTEVGPQAWQKVSSAP